MYSWEFIDSSTNSRVGDEDADCYYGEMVGGNCDIFINKEPNHE